MPRGIPKAAAGAAQTHDHSTWDAFAAAAMTGMLQRGNQSSLETVAAAANAADRLMEEREKRFGKAVVPAAQEDDAA